VREACAEAGTLPKPHSGRRIAPDDLVGVAEPSIRVLGMPEWCDEPRPDVSALVVAAAGPQLDDQLRDPVVARKEDPNHAVL
jgi:hypothetical protein